jgi:hypothetical protein
MSFYRREDFGKVILSHYISYSYALKLSRRFSIKPRRMPDLKE